MMVVQTRTSKRPASKSSITRSSMPSAIWPWPMAILARGTRRRTRSAAVSMVSTRLWTKKTWPPRSSSRLMASRTRPSSSSAMRVWIGSRASGGVSMTDRSRMPTRLRCRVRGIGVADRVSTSTSLRNDLMRSLCATPKRCSSSTTSRPRSAKAMSFDRIRCVPISTSTVPSGDARHDLLLLPLRHEAAEHGHLHRERAEPPLEGAQVLLRQHGGRHQHRHLLAVLHRLEGGAQRDLGLAVADVAADQPIHRPAAEHVALHLLDGAQLVRRLACTGTPPPARAARRCPARS